MTVSPARSPRPSWSHRRRGALLAAVAVALLAACTPVKAGSAAVVGEETLSESQVADGFQEISEIATANELPPPAAPDLNLRLVGLWVEETLTETLAEREDVTVSAGDVDEFLGQFTDEDLVQIAVSSGIGPSTIDRAAATQLLQTALAQQLAPGASVEAQGQALRAALADLAAELGVSVNPRFGSFDPETAQVGPRDETRLSSPQPADESPVPVPVVPEG